MTVDEMREAVEVERDASLWGQHSRFTPRLLPKVFGDGRQLIWFETMDTRPWFWVLMVDSNWVLSNFDVGDNFCNHTQEVIAALEEEFGRCDGDGLRLKDKKGGDWDEWPADLRVREFPEVTRGRVKGSAQLALAAAGREGA